jgi:hypothetical protein
MSPACNAVMHGQHAHPPCPQHDCCCDEIGPAAGAFALSALTQRGAKAHRTLLGPLDLARRYEGVGLYTRCDHHGQLITMKQDKRLILDVDYYIVHFKL